jgi:hypothetical protein
MLFKNLTDHSKKVDLIGDRPSAQRDLYFPKQIEIRRRDIGGIGSMLDPLQRVAPAKVSGHPSVVSQCMVNVHYQFSSPWTPRSREEFLKQED